jgi:hypothetical protein
MGGELEIVARLPDGDVRVDQVTEDATIPKCWFLTLALMVPLMEGPERHRHGREGRGHSQRVGETLKTFRLDRRVHLLVERRLDCFVQRHRAAAPPLALEYLVFQRLAQLRRIAVVQPLLGQLENGPDLLAQRFGRAP